MRQKWLLEQTISLTSSEKIAFLTACNGQAKGVEDAKEYARRHPGRWIPYKKGSKDKQIFVMNFNNVQLFD
ncbi:MAG: hypothetical protein GY750_14290, partial [Lentisphaerae bacterium]|nr:hypothetical protein [Lentisphaerota bacterium]